MLTHLLFSISALIFMIIFIITYFSYKNNTDTARNKIYVSMIYFALALTLTEIIEGVAYVYNFGAIFSLMWKLHSVIMTIFIAALFYYYLASIVDVKVNNFEDILFDSNKPLSIRNLFSVLFVLAIIIPIIIVKTYPIGLTMFYFYTEQAIDYLLALYVIYILYNIYIVYLKFEKNNFERNDYIVLIGNFILFVIALVFEYFYSEISIYSTLFTLVLILIYYFKENADLLTIEELKKEQTNLSASSDMKLLYLRELVNDLENPINNIKELYKELENCENLSNEEIDNKLSSLNSISESIVNVLNNQTADKYVNYRIDRVVQNIQKSVEPSLKSKPVKFTYTIDNNIPSLLIGDRIKIQKIISSIVSNAIKNTEVGKIMVDITGEKQRDNILLNIRIADTGNGIKNEDFGKVFAENTACNSGFCSWALAKRYVDELKGSIRFESHYGSGTLFYISIYQKIGSDTPIASSPLQSDDIAVKDYKNKRVLVIDDEDYSSKKMTNILKKYNLVAECIKFGKDSIDKIKTGEEYSLIIINDNIKDINYIELGRVLSHLKGFVTVPPIVVLTLHIKDGDGKYYINEGFDEYLTKPLNIKKLNKIIEKRCI